jgi:hypothetical protein
MTFSYFLLLYRMGFHAHTSQDTIQSSDAFKVPSYVLRAMMMGQVNFYDDVLFMMI